MILLVENRKMPTSLSFLQSLWEVFWLSLELFTFQRHYKTYNLKRQRKNANFLPGVFLGNCYLKFSFVLGVGWHGTFPSFPHQSPQYPPLHPLHLPRDSTS